MKPGRVTRQEVLNFIVALRDISSRASYLDEKSSARILRIYLRWKIKDMPLEAAEEFVRRSLNFLSRKTDPTSMTVIPYRSTNENILDDILMRLAGDEFPVGLTIEHKLKYIEKEISSIQCDISSVRTGQQTVPVKMLAKRLACQKNVNVGAMQKAAQTSFDRLIGSMAFVENGELGHHYVWSKGLFGSSKRLASISDQYRQLCAYSASGHLLSDFKNMYISNLASREAIL